MNKIKKAERVHKNIFHAIFNLALRAHVEWANSFQIAQHFHSKQLETNCITLKIKQWIKNKIKQIRYLEYYFIITWVFKRVLIKMIFLYHFVVIFSRSGNKWKKTLTVGGIW